MLMGILGFTAGQRKVCGGLPEWKVVVHKDVFVGRSCVSQGGALKKWGGKSMKINKEYEAEIILRDFLFHILYEWRIILLVGLIAAAVFGYREYQSFEKYHKAGELTPEEKQYEATMADREEALAQVEADIASYDKLIEEKRNYRNNSILMKIDPTNIWTAEKKYYLNMNDSPGDHSFSTMTTLGEAFFLDIPEETLMEVFGTVDRSDINQIATISLNRSLHTISVIGCGSTEEEAVQRKEFVDIYLHKAEQKRQEAYIFTLDLLSDSVGTKTVLTTRNISGDIVEKDLALIQNTVNDNIWTYQEKQKPYLTRRNDLKAMSINKPSPNVGGQAFLGLILGIFISILCSSLYYLFNGKLKTLQEMKKRYDICILGEFSHSRAWRKGKGVDWVLEKLEFGKQRTVPDNELDSIVFLIDGEKDGKTIMLTGTAEDKKLKKIYEGLASRAQGKGINLVLQPDYLRNSKAVEMSRKAESVIWVEERYKSRVKEMNRMAEMLTIEDAKVIGAVLI